MFTEKGDTRWCRVLQLSTLGPGADDVETEAGTRHGSPGVQQHVDPLLPSEPPDEEDVSALGRRHAAPTRVGDKVRSHHETDWRETCSDEATAGEIAQHDEAVDEPTPGAQPAVNGNACGGGDGRRSTASPIAAVLDRRPRAVFEAFLARGAVSQEQAVDAGQAIVVHSHHDRHAAPLQRRKYRGQCR